MKLHDAMGGFLEKLASELSAAGFKAEKQYDDILVVNGCRFVECEVVKDGKGRPVVKFHGKSFLVEDDGFFDVHRAIGIVISELGGRLKARAEAEAFDKHRADVLETVQGRRIVLERKVFFDCVKLEERDVYIGWSAAGVEVVRTFATAEEALRAVQSS